MKKLLIPMMFAISFFSFSVGGLEEKHTTDGKPHFEKILGKVWAFPDTPDTFQIIKDGDSYYINHFSFDELTDSEIEKTDKVTVFKNIYFSDGMYYYAYDTKYKTAVIIDSSDMKIIFPADKITE